MVLDGAHGQDRGAADRAIPTADPDGDGVVNEIPTSLVDYMEFYLLNYFKPGHGEQTADARRRRPTLFEQIGCTGCHVPNLTIDHDRRVADVETVVRSRARASSTGLFATATPLFTTTDDGSGFPPLKQPARAAVRRCANIFTDFKRHDLGPNFHERNYDGTMRTRVHDDAALGRRQQRRPTATTAAASTSTT